MKSLFGCIVTLMIFIAGCGSAPPQKTIRTDFNPATDFRVYKSYRWFDGPFLPGDPATADEPQYRTVRDAINMVLSEKGYEWLQFQPTDLVLHIHSGFDSPPQVDAWITYNWYKPWWGAYGPMIEVSRFDPGMLVFDVIDAKSTELVWRGLIPRFYTADGAFRDVEGFPAEIQEMLKNFPQAVR
ncbi:MAG: DUF4136 domain-containing protein [Bacteroidetes bacterium]|nr:DUF4136 domain-containing protein [Bacteroidota bacterium]